MARATRHNGVVDRDDLPEDMQVFTVVGATIVDSLGAYCTEGQEAALNKADATRYHKMKLIQVALPDFEAAPAPAKKGATNVGKSASGASAKIEVAASADSGEASQEPAADGEGAGITRRV